MRSSRLFVPTVVALIGILGVANATLAQKTRKKTAPRAAATVSVAPSIENAEAKRLFGAATGLLAQGQYRDAIATFELALPLCRADNDPVGEGIVLNNIGVAYSRLGEHARAAEAYSRAAPLSQAGKDRAGEATALFNLGVASYELSERPEVIVGFYERALAIYRDLRDRSREADTLYNLGVVYTWNGQNEKAAEHYERSKAVRRE